MPEQLEHWRNHDALATFENARARSVAEDLFGIRAGKCVACDFFAAFDAFEQEGIARALRNAKVGAHRSQKIGGKNVVDRNQVALFGETLKLLEIGLNHRWLFCLGAFGFVFPVLWLVPPAHAVIAIYMTREDRKHREIVDAIERHGPPPGWRG